MLKFLIILAYHIFTQKKNFSLSDKYLTGKSLQLLANVFGFPPKENKK